MKHLIRQYLEGRISRRNFLSSLGAFGISAVAANSTARSLAPFSVGDEESDRSAPSWMREMRGTGGELLVAQIKAAGVEHIFFNPSSGEAPIFDALVDEPGIHPIKGLQEGALAAMADGYAKASGKTPFILVARPGFPNFMTQLLNTYKDQVPLVVITDYLSRENLGQDGFQDVDHMETMAQPLTKWYWWPRRQRKFRRSPGEHSNCLHSSLRSCLHSIS